MALSNSDLLALARDLESDRVERKASLSDSDRIREAICAFANDLPGHEKPGVIFIGIRDDGACANLSVDDNLLRRLGDFKDDGAILPRPSMDVQKVDLDGCVCAVIAVYPSDAPPVKFSGRVWVRVGPRRSIATPEEEKRLNQRRRGKDLPFDIQPVAGASVRDLDTNLFVREYLPAAVAEDVLEQNQRSLELQLASLRFSDLDEIRPTAVGLLVCGRDPRAWIPGAYIQFLRIDGEEWSSPILDQQELSGPLSELMRQLETLLAINNAVRTDIRSGTREIRSRDYPKEALDQVVRNAIIHRDYESSNAPIRIYWFRDRVEIHSPGGPYGIVNAQNFGRPGVTDYRNPHVAEAMKNLGYVQKFGMGIQLAKKAMADNGNPPPQFDVQPTAVLVILRKAT